MVFISYEHDRLEAVAMIEQDSLTCSCGAEVTVIVPAGSEAPAVCPKCGKHYIVSIEFSKAA